MTKESIEILQYNKVKWRKRLQISTATEGWIRYEWSHRRYGQVIPVNWEATGFDVFTAIQYSIDDAYNLIVKRALQSQCEWLLIIEDDVLIPSDTFLRMGRYMDEKKYPVVSGLYYTKSEPAVPLLFRGRGNGAYATDWDIGDVVMVDGLPMGCLLIHMSIIEYMWDHSPQYQLSDGVECRKVFETPRRIMYDPEKGIERQEGTQDLFFFDKILEFDVLRKTGWDKVADEKYPLVCDTNIFCKHICRNTGRQYP